ncbi:DUF2254 domain-containing protein [Sphingomonas sp.]|uniref:DUF2254 domain-containing protein n=1 Tax=Sphingomonas sp. TaxID=28214 RepID=UPI0035C7F438
MKGALRRLTDYLGSSYWFVPSIMALAAVVLAGSMVSLDSFVGSSWMDGYVWLYASRPDGARQVLSSVGGSMITVAGTVFSVTIAAVVYASGQYGPRLLTNFMRDRGNQVTLGTFIATFLYCLLVLRTIHSAEESGGYGFVPNLALLVGVLLALCSIGVLIYFIHHVPSKIHINSVIEDVGDRLLRSVGDRFPHFVGEAPDDQGDTRSDVPETFREGSDIAAGHDRREVKAKETGYIQFIDDEAVMRLAREHGLVLRLQYQSGDFVHVGRALLEAAPPSRCDDECASDLRGVFTVGSRRSALQDIRFLIDELVEIAARALSPGVNDPFTAVTCLDWLGAALSDLATRSLPSHLRVDDDGALRVIAHPETFASFMDRSFGALAQYCATDMIAGLRYLNALGEVSLECDQPERLATVETYADKLEQLASEGLSGFNLQRIRDRAAELRRALAAPDYKRRLRDGTAWLAGTA